MNLHEEKQAVIILGIESSCDDTSIAVIKDGEILSNFITSQWIHKKYGGVVPESASRQHVESIIDVADEALKLAGITLPQLSAIAVTRGPGLMGSLLVGISFAKALSLSLNIPLIEVNHMHAHLMSLFIDEQAEFPLLCLTVSGGHTQMTILKSDFEIELIGTTLDDAAGEAFDKTGKLLGLSYPAGPVIDQLAQLGKPIYPFPISKVKGYNFSFSGLKTAVLYFLKEQLQKDALFIDKNLNDLCASIQYNICTSLVLKVKSAAIASNIKAVGVAGGVSANSNLRKEMQILCDENNWRLFLPKNKYCTDNGAMIAMSGYKKYIAGNFVDDTFAPLARYPIP